MAIVIPIVTEFVKKGLDDANKAVKGTEKEVGSFASGLKKVTPIAAVAFGAVIAGAKLSLDAAGKAAASNKKLTAVFKATGDETGKGAAAAIKYADALARKTGIDRNVIKSSQTMLAAFSNVSGEAARAAGVFDQATAAAHDMAAAGFGDAIGNAKLLGKALQDPVKYSGALAKAGVVLTKAEQDKIKAYQSSGKLLEAQKVILDKVKGSVGGTAEATASSSAKMKIAWQGLYEQLGTVLLPVMGKVREAIGALADFMGNNVGAVQILAGVIGILSGSILALGVALKIINMVKAFTAAIHAMNLAFLANPVVLVVVGIAALIAVLVLAYKKVEWFRNVVNAAFNGIKLVVGAVVNFIRDNWLKMLIVLTGPIGVAIALVIANLDKLKAAFSVVFSAIKGFVSGAWDFLRGIFDKIAAAIKGLIDKLGPLKGLISKIPGLGSALPAGVGARRVTWFPTPVAGLTRTGSARSSTTAAGSLGVGATIIVQGAVDPEATARAIRRLLTGSDIRNGRTAAFA